MTLCARSGNTFRHSIARHLFSALLLLLLCPGPVSAQQTFTISTSYQNLLSNREQTGILDRLFAEVFERLGIEMEMIFTPTNSSMVDVNAGILDAEANRIAGMEQEYPHLVRVPEPNMTMEFVAFARRDYRIDGWQSIQDLDIALVRGRRILEQHTKEFPHVVTVPTEIELFNMLRKDRIDVALYAKLTGYATLREIKQDGTYEAIVKQVRREYGIDDS